MTGERTPPAAERLRASWEENAASWTAAVRGGLIGSRRAGTDEAILRACRRLGPDRILDVGCGEGWLTRALSSEAAEVVGIDASVALIERARAEGGATYAVLAYDQLASDPRAVAGPWDVIVCNFALLDDRIGPLLTALRARLARDGRLLIQTVHPDNVAGGESSGWREETFDSFGIAFPAPMPWYFRNFDDWLAELNGAGLILAGREAPLHPATGEPLSLLLECVAADPAEDP